ncbi:MAG TPA: fibronectin type III domain-containing protein, partial [Candidatus Hydrogenedentes bacterium]|nr:fibronectin type III domain-containing protein [Candidatus Hydrogenedentota bacterium]
PYLQYPTETSMTVGWETSQPASTEAGQGKGADALTWVTGDTGGTFHTVVFDMLEPGGNYFYQVRSAMAPEPR